MWYIPACNRVCNGCGPRTLLHYPFLRALIRDHGLPSWPVGPGMVLGPHSTTQSRLEDASVSLAESL